MSTGLRSKVEGRTKAYLENPKGYCDGSKIDLYERAYKFYEKAYKLILEVGYVPKCFFDMEEDFGLRLKVKGLFKWYFGKEIPYENFPKHFHTPEYKKWFISCRNYIRQQMDHYASEYFATIILYWNIKNWVVSLDDLLSGIPSLDEKAKRAWEKSNKWITKQNDYIANCFN